MIEGDLLAGAVAFAREIAGKPAPKTRERNQKLGTPEQNAPIFAAARDTARKKQRDLIAPLAAIDAVEAATRLPFEEGCEAEAKLFIECLFSDQSKALIHVFFGEREVAKIPDIPKETPVIPVNPAAVVGAGTMGGGIAMVFANAGIPVLLKEADQAALDRGLANIRKNYANSVKRGRFTQAVRGRALEADQADAQLRRFRQCGHGDRGGLRRHGAEEGSLRASWTASASRARSWPATLPLSISTKSRRPRRGPQSVIGTHFFSPANVMRLLEIVRGKTTEQRSDCHLHAAFQETGQGGRAGGQLPRLRRQPHVSSLSCAKRISWWKKARSVEAVDKALYDFGMAMGPLATGDLAGLDVGWRIRKEYRHLEKPGVRQPFAEDRLCEMGRFGQKTGAGWYKYDENRARERGSGSGRTGSSNGRRRPVSRSGKISAAEIVDRCIYALVNEGARILEEGYALRAVDIDIIYLNGYGFPAYRGGPMWYADTVGLKKVYDRISEFHQQHGELWEPAPLLKQLAEEGKTFADFDKEKVRPLAACSDQRRRTNQRWP